MTLLTEIELLRPLALVLIPLPWLFQRLVRSVHIDTGMILPERMMSFLQSMNGTSATQVSSARIRSILAWAGWLALVLALCGPLSGKTPLPDATGRDLFVVIDLSVSMRAIDVQLDNELISREEAVKTLAGTFIRGRDGDRVGLIVFANQPFLIAPLTYDVGAVSQYMQEVGVGLPGRKTAVGDAIALGIQQLQSADGESRVMLLLTDGVSNAGDNTPLRAAEMARHHNIRIHTIGFGGHLADAPPQVESELQLVASTTGGKYFPAPSADALRAVYAVLDTLEPTQSKHATRFIHRDLTPYLLAFSLFMALCLTWLDWRGARL